MTPKSTEHQQAFNLYFQSDLTNKQIADMLNIDRKTLFTWAKEGDWKKAKDTIRHAPSFLVEQYYDQLNEINRAIAQRTERPYPTKEEATIIKTISATIKQIGVRQSASEAMDVFIDFGLEVCRYDPAFHRQMIVHMDKYVQHLTDYSLERYRSRYRWEQKKDQEYEQYLAEQEELARDCEEPAGPSCDGATKQPRETQPKEKQGDDGVMNGDDINDAAALRSVSPLSSDGVIMGSSSEAPDTTKTAPEATNQNIDNTNSKEKTGNGVMSESDNSVPNPPADRPVPEKNGVINSGDANPGIPASERFQIPNKEAKDAPLIITNCVGRYVIEMRNMVGRLGFKTTLDKPEAIIDVTRLPSAKYTVTITDSAGNIYEHEVMIRH
jgi:hypothetical protein